MFLPYLLKSMSKFSAFLSNAVSGCFSLCNEYNPLSDGTVLASLVSMSWF